MKKHTLKKALPFSLTAIAIIAICWYLFTFFNVLNQWYTLITIAFITGIMTLVIPIIACRFKPINSIIATGFAILLTITVLPFLVETPIHYISNLTLIIYTVALTTEWLSYKKVHLGDFIFDFIISLISALLITKTNNNLLVTLILIICYTIILCVNFRFSISLKKSKTGKNDNSSKSDLQGAEEISL